MRGRLTIMGVLLNWIVGSCGVSDHLQGWGILVEWDGNVHVLSDMCIPEEE